jgi:hypothetical protein
MSESEKADEKLQGVDTKTKMLAALANKQKRISVTKVAGTSSRSKIGAGQTSGAAPKMHRRKSGSA